MASAASPLPTSLFHLRHTLLQTSSAWQAALLHGSETLHTLIQSLLILHSHTHKPTPIPPSPGTTSTQASLKTALQTLHTILRRLRSALGGIHRWLHEIRTDDTEMLTDTVTDLVEGYVQGLERDLKEKKDIVDSVERYMERGRVVKETCFSWPCAWQEALALSQAPDVAVVVACMEAAWNVRCAHVEHVHEGADVCKRKDDVSPALAALLGGHS